MTGAGEMIAAGTDNRIELGNAHVRLVVSRERDRWTNPLCSCDGEWIPLLVSGIGSARILTGGDGRAIGSGYTSARMLGSAPGIQEVELTAADGSLRSRNGLPCGKRTRLCT
jgi:hypothetical protein